MSEAQLDFEFVQQEIEMVKSALESNDFELAWEKLENLYLLHLENSSPELANEISKLKQKALQKMIVKMRQTDQE
jgi:hypothetical protein